jgi:hypothetical protein
VVENKDLTGFQNLLGLGELLDLNDIGYWKRKKGT